MTKQLKFMIAQAKPVVGATAANADQLRAIRRSAPDDVDLIVASELFISGYPPEDLVLKPSFQRACAAAVHGLAQDTADGGPALLVGAPWRPHATQSHDHPELDNPQVGLRADQVYNAALLLDGGAVAAVRAKHLLPNYGVFDEKRVFAAGPTPGPIAFRDVRLGVMICEDLWSPDVAEALAESGAQILIALNSSPFDEAKADQRSQIALARAAETDLSVLYVNQVGGQDELVFDGGSFAMNSGGELAAMAPYFSTAAPVWRLADGPSGWRAEVGARPADEGRLERIYRAMILGLQDYVGKNGFPGVVLGLSGGIDSALTAAVAVDALGADRVRCLLMPSVYTSRASVEDAAGCARRLDVRFYVAPIDPMMSSVGQTLTGVLGRPPLGVTAENVQSRLRGLTLMAASNATGAMLLTTGNKSEISVGYATLYGDMCGGYSVLKDVYKTDVFALARWRNSHRPAGALGPEVDVMPERIITKPPSAELRPEQTDEDSLPPYDRLDAMLRGLIERDEDLDDLVAQGFDRAEAAHVRGLLDRAEYKRRQAPPGVKITARTLSRDRRYPITNGFRG